MNINNIQKSQRGLEFRPRAEFKNEIDYLQQFQHLARPKLTKKLFFQLPAGLYLTPNGSGFENMEVAPESERATQWKSIYPGARQRLCEIYRNKAHYEAMLAEGRKIQAKSAGGSPKSKPTLDTKSACEILSRFMSFGSQPLAESVQAAVLVLKVKRGVPESAYALEVAKIALKSIEVYEMTGKVEFLTGHTSNGDYVFCAGYEPFVSHPRATDIFNARMKGKMPILAHKSGVVKLNKAQCAVEELISLRTKYVNQGFFVFGKGKINMRHPGGDSWIAKVLGPQPSVPEWAQ